jgi:tripartite-type tricarboxylate transporter receptor subunit TctC
MGEALDILRDDDLVAWYGLLVPSRTPAEAVQALEKAAFAVLRRPDTKARLAALGTDVVAMAGAPFAERMRTESRRYAEVIQRFSIKAG